MSVCSMQGCNDIQYSKTKCSLEQLTSIVDTVGCHISPSVAIPTPFCKVHYHLVYNALQPQQTHCPTCGSSLRSTTGRPCPDQLVIQQYLLDKTGFEGDINNGAKVCFACYKCHLHILKEVKIVSKGIELLTLITT